MQADPRFNAVASTYDEDFTRSITGILQRRRVWGLLNKYTKEPLRILEINCGTGEDAIMLADNGHHVTATDLSEEMIRVASRKSIPANLHFSVCGFDRLLSQYAGETYQLIFSDFAGLNCVDASTLKKLDSDFYQLLEPGGKLVMVMLGKKCWTERIFFTLKGDPLKARRRMQESMAKLNDHTTQQTYCYTTKEIEALFSSFKLVEQKPVGIFIPPSYLEPWMKRKRFLVPFIQLAEWLTGSMSFLSNYADHAFLVLEKK